MRPVRRFSEDYQMTPKQEEALRDYLRETVVPLIEDVLAKKLGQALTFAKEELAQPAPVQEPVAWMDVDEKGAMYSLRFWSEPDNRHEVALYTMPPAQPAPVQKRPQNCGTNYCSCVECVMEPTPVQGPYSAPVKEMWPAVPDAIGPHEDELPAYAAGWNDCRAEMLKARSKNT
jgi:hypothetical protein